jgi:hypothetical protein
MHTYAHLFISAETALSLQLAVGTLFCYIINMSKNYNTSLSLVRHCRNEGAAKSRYAKPRRWRSCWLPCCRCSRHLRPPCRYSYSCCCSCSRQIRSRHLLSCCRRLCFRQTPHQHQHLQVLHHPCCSCCRHRCCRCHCHCRCRCRCRLASCHDPCQPRLDPAQAHACHVCMRAMEATRHLDGCTATRPVCAACKDKKKAGMTLAHTTPHQGNHIPTPHVVASSPTQSHVSPTHTLTSWDLNTHTHNNHSIFFEYLCMHTHLLILRRLPSRVVCPIRRAPLTRPPALVWCAGRRRP